LKLQTAIVAVGLLALTQFTYAQTRVQGIDVSSFQGNMNWDTAYDQGVRFTFMRASRGPSAGTGFFNDPELFDNISLLRSQATRASNPRTIYNGFYHYGRPDLIAIHSNDGGDPDDQQPTFTTIQNSARDEAAHFWSVIDQDMSRSGADALRRLRPVLDVEERGGEDSTGTGGDADTFPDTDVLTRANLSIWVDEFLTHFTSLSGGIRPILYMNTNYATNFVDSRLADEKLWVANWTDDPTGNPGDGVFPGWSFWQYSSAGNQLGDEYGASVGETADIDLDVANGDINFVRSFLIPEPGTATLVVGFALTYLGTTRRRRA
jgi:GH25 family lysozyme M1 (1,4-beta-N-acetylmuramidase)